MAGLHDDVCAWLLAHRHAYRMRARLLCGSLCPPTPRAAPGPTAARRHRAFLVQVDEPPACLSYGPPSSSWRCPCPSSSCPARGGKRPRRPCVCPSSDHGGAASALERQLFMFFSLCRLEGARNAPASAVAPGATPPKPAADRVGESHLCIGEDGGSLNACTRCGRCRRAT